MTASVSKWLDWVPSKEKFSPVLEGDPTKPSKPRFGSREEGFVGFVGTEEGESQNFRSEEAIAENGSDQPPPVDKFQQSAKTDPTKPTKPIDGQRLSSSRQGLTPAEWQAQGLNRIFDEHGTGAPGKPITAADVEEWEVRSRWGERWPDKPFGQPRLKDGSLDPEVRDWVCEQLRKAGTRFLVVGGQNSLACWPEQNGPEYQLVLRLVALDHFTVYSRDEPRIQRLLTEQHPGRP